jgi:hypothetical protein
MRKYFSKPDSLIDSTVDRNGAAPALLTRMSTPPSSEMVFSTSALT